MQRVIFHLEDRQVKGIDRIIAMSEYGTDRSKVLRTILDEHFRRNGVILDD